MRCGASASEIALASQSQGTQPSSMAQASSELAVLIEVVSDVASNRATRSRDLTPSSGQRRQTIPRTSEAGHQPLAVCPVLARRWLRGTRMRPDPDHSQDHN